MASIKQLITEIHRRSLWQVVAIYAAASWVVLEAADVLVERLSLPDWVYGVAIVLLLVGLPIVLATAFVQEGFISRTSRDPTLLPTEERVAHRTQTTGVRGLLTWRNAIGGGVVAFALWGVVATALLLFGDGPRGEMSSDALASPDPAVVAVLPFRTSGAEASLSYLREGMIDLLAAKLTGEGGPRAADPRSVMTAWNRVAGSEEEDLPQEAAFEVARSVGAGRVLLGAIVGTAERLVLNASLLEVGDGATRAQASVDGSADSLTSLVDQLAAQLLAREAGEAEQRLSALTSTSLAALRAYLDGQAAYRRGAHARAAEHFGRAIEEDSSFAMAALGRAYSTYWSENQFDQRALAVAWRHQERLSERDRALLLSVTGPAYPEPPANREVLRLAERAVEISPERAESWYWLGEVYYHGGAALGFGDGRARAEAAFVRAVELDSAFASALFHLVDLIAMRGDTPRFRKLSDLYASIGASGAAADIRSWLAARTLADSAALREVHDRFPRMSQTALRAIARQTQLRGMPLHDAELAVMALNERMGTRAERWEAAVVEHDLRLNQGRPGAALAVTDRIQEVSQDPHRHLNLRVLDGLFGGGDPGAAAHAVERLEAHAAGPTLADNPEQEVFNLCSIQLWRLAHADRSSGAAALVRLKDLMREVEPGTIWGCRVCIALIEAMLAEQSGGRGSSTERLDSLMLLDPPVGWHLHRAANLSAAQLFENRGELERALAAVRRRHFYQASYLATHLREEGRLAALTGDRDGAIRAYRRYLTLRSDPEPAMVPEVESVRAELELLVGEGATP